MKKQRRFTPQQIYYLFHHISVLGFDCVPKLAKKFNADEWDIRLAYEMELNKKKERERLESC